MTSTSILIVDDDPLVRELVKLHLGRSGHHVIQAASGQEALALIEQEAPQLILLDFAMPGLTGVDVLRTLRGNERTSQIPVVMVTAWRADAERALSEELGVLWMPKPIIGDTLTATVRQIVGGGQDKTG